MITKQDILDRAGEWGLRAHVVEKDYVLGWLLVAIGQHPVLGKQWVFKGGTCLKKCYFETYRFSEDLDFTLLPAAMYEAEGLRAVLVELAEAASDLSGVEFLVETVEVQSRNDRQGRPAFGAKLAYRGPMQTPTPPRVLFDLTKHEPVVDESVQREVHHPYPDAPSEEPQVRCYSINELFAEKLRALCERTRPRDLYDVIHVLSSAWAALDLNAVRRIFAAKCRFKAFEPPDPQSIVALARDSIELAAEWNNMLAHQLPELPPISSFLDRLPPLLGWLAGTGTSTSVNAALSRASEAGRSVAPTNVTYWNLGVPLELIRFAGANRLLVEFTYHAKRRTVEPYSLRMPDTGNLLLYAWELATQQVKAFSVNEIQAVRVTSTPFVARFQVELTAIRAFESRSPARDPHYQIAPRPRRPSLRRASTVSTKYVFECSLCRKRFVHTTNSPTLRVHRRGDGFGDCPGTRGYGCVFVPEHAVA